MAKKNSGKSFGLYKEKVVNYCINCGQEAEAVKSLQKKSRGGLGKGTFWCCKDEHCNRIRNYKILKVKVR